MSSSTSRSSAADVLAHPEIVALVLSGRAAGHVSAEQLRAATAAAGTAPRHLQAVVRHLSQEGVTVMVSAEDGKPHKVVAAAASTARTTVTATATRTVTTTRRPTSAAPS